MPTAEMTANMMTKALPEKLHYQHVNTVMVCWVGMLISSVLQNVHSYQLVKWRNCIAGPESRGRYENNNNNNNSGSVKKF